MSMTPASSEYFEKVASQWDTIRAGYFTEAVRQAAIDKAYLRPEMVVADVGAGTGFMAAGLAPLVQQVYVLDGSPAMLDVARQNLKDFANVVYQQADGATLPLPDGSLDAVFANMYLHHTPDPQAAIREMARLLRPGGRLVITDMDSHPFTWLKDEMADVWQGFERAQVREWLKAAGLVNALVTSSGQSCCAESQAASLVSAGGQVANISIFVAAGTQRTPGVTEAVQAGYSAAAQGKKEAVSDENVFSSCCSSPAAEENATAAAAGCCEGATSASSSSCCGGSSELISFDAIPDVQFNPEYTSAEKSAVPPEAAELSLGCGNPTAIAALRAGEVVVDIGSGAGMDAFLSAQKVGPAGRVIGVDMTPAMLERARQTAARRGLSNVEFREGHAEQLPVDDATVDVVISNCVINLVADKSQVFGEAYRVLKPGGRLDVSDMVTDRAFPLVYQQNPADWPGCVFGALPEQEYVDLLVQAGFQQIQVRRSPAAGVAGDVRVYSITVSARK